MNIHVLRVAALATLVACAAACSRSRRARVHAGHSPDHTRAPAPRTSKSSACPTATLDALADARYSPQQWSEILRVSVDRRWRPGGRPLRGRRRRAPVHAGSFRSIPGGRYQVRFDPRACPDGESAVSRCRADRHRRSACRRPHRVAVHRRHARVSERRRRCPRTSCGCTSSSRRRWDDEAESSTSRCSTSEDEEVEGPFLPLDYEFWNADRTRFTVFFDPGRVKHGILPNKQMGRALKVGRSYTLLVRVRMAGRQRSAAQGIIPSHVPRRAARHPSARHRAVANRRRPGPARRRRSSSPFPSRSITVCCFARSASDAVERSWTAT